MAFNIPGFSSGSLNALMSIGTFVGGSVNIDSTAKLHGFIFKASVSQQMNGIVYGAGSNVGTVTNKAQIDLYAVSDTGVPTGASLATQTYTPTQNALNTVNFASPYTTTAGTCYAVVWQGLSGIDGSNKFGLNDTFAVATFPARGLFWANNMFIQSVDTGATWQNNATASQSYIGSVCAAPNYQTLGIDCNAVLIASGQADAPVALYNVAAGAGERTARNAFKWNCPHDVLLWGVYGMFRAKTGTPTYDLVGEVCSATASLSTSATVSNSANSVASQPLSFLWSTPYRLIANTDYYIGITPSAVGDGASGKHPNLQVATPIVKTPTVGPIWGYYESSNYNTPSFAQSASLMADMQLLIEVPGGGGMITVGP